MNSVQATSKIYKTKTRREACNNRIKQGGQGPEAWILGSNQSCAAVAGNGIPVAPTEVTDEG